MPRLFKALMFTLNGAVPTIIRARRAAGNSPDHKQQSEMQTLAADCQKVVAEQSLPIGCEGKDDQQGQKKYERPLHESQDMVERKP